MAKFDVVGFGALNFDVLMKVDRIACAEEESFIESFSEVCGGSAANTMVGLSRLGCKTGFIGKVAGDREGKLQLDGLDSEGVDTNGIIRAKDGRSGSVLGFVDRKGERTLYVNPGVNDTIDPKEIPPDYISGVRFLHLTSFVGEKSLKTQIAFLNSLPNIVKVSFDPGAVYAKLGFKPIEPIIKKTHLMMPNSLELKQITGETDYRKGADFLLAHGVKIAAVKLGEKGCYVTDGKEHLNIEPFKVKALDTTGAGDAFCAGFLYGLLNAKSLLECGRLGNFVASRSIMQMGARAGLPYKKDMTSFSV